MNTENLAADIGNAKKRTPVKLWVWSRGPTGFPGCRVFTGSGGCCLVFGDWEQVKPLLEAQKEAISHWEVECTCRNSALPLVPIEELSARIEPGAIVRQGARVGEQAVILMGAIVNTGAVIGRGTMIDMGAVVGARAQVGEFCHIGAGAVLAGVLEPPSARPVVIEDGVLVGANGVVLEGCRVGRCAVVAAGAVVTGDVPARAVVAGCPARILKFRDAQTDEKTEISHILRNL